MERCAKHKTFHQEEIYCPECYEEIISLNARAMCAHSECLGLNSTNFWCIVQDQAPIYDTRHFGEILQKWGLVDEKGEPTF